MAQLIEKIKPNELGDFKVALPTRRRELCQPWSPFLFGEEGRMEGNEVKLCECGCGNPAPIAKKTVRKRGHIKGQPIRFIQGHKRLGYRDKCLFWKGGIIKRESYIGVYLPDHHRAQSTGYVLSHIMTAETALGKELPKYAVVHHHSESQLVICQNQAYHRFLHQRINALKKCGHADWRRCWVCKTYDAPDNMVITKLNQAYHRECFNKIRRERHYGRPSNAKNKALDSYANSVLKKAERFERR